MSQGCEGSVPCLVPARPSFSSRNRCISAGPGLQLRRKTGHKHLFPLPVIPATHKAPSPLARPCCRTVREAGGGLGTCVFSCVWPDRGGKPEGQCEAPDRWKKEQLFWLSFTLQMWSNVIVSHPNTETPEHSEAPGDCEVWKCFDSPDSFASPCLVVSRMLLCSREHPCWYFSPHRLPYLLGPPCETHPPRSESLLGCLLLIPGDPQPDFCFSHCFPTLALTPHSSFKRLCSPLSWRLMEAEGRVLLPIRPTEPGPMLGFRSLVQRTHQWPAHSMASHVVSLPHLWNQALSLFISRNFLEGQIKWWTFF